MRESCESIGTTDLPALDPRQGEPGRGGEGMPMAESDRPENHWSRQGGQVSPFREKKAEKYAGGCCQGSYHSGTQNTRPI
ncbi:hypothetical protein DPEC_G00357110 [Dallia pectoralis]|uniref:Uncharacterized protein n=1 Tax=Dallia pectoralis TaxID=75939 RepID=A0ACC2F038_DALPE|nr:hypothetical protein DPEC_G00357110 [Dallia pectoralis]